MRLLALLSLYLIACASLAQAALRNGPMLAHLEMREAQIWVQAEVASVVRVNYTATGSQTSHWSHPVETNASKGHTALVYLDKIEPGTRYDYRVELNGELVGPSASFATLDNYYERRPAPDFKFAVGGAHYAVEDGFEPPYRTLGGGYDIFSTIAGMEPAFMLWVGNTAHLRPADWSSQSGYLKRYAKARAVPQLGPLLQSIPHYATWGDSDYSA
ncbi:MAG: hypothetical protein EA353_01015, partial [Puniceicoccaceae bacterium]